MRRALNILLLFFTLPSTKQTQDEKKKEKFTKQGLNNAVGDLFRFSEDRFTLPFNVGHYPSYQI